MLYVDIALFFSMIFVLVKSADFSIKFSHSLSRELNVQDFVISFFLVSIISVLPETSISIISALNKTPQFGLGTILGSTIADLTLVFGIVSLFSNDGIKVRSVFIRSNMFLLFLVIFPFVLGLDGSYSRTDGFILLLLGVIFLYGIFSKSRKYPKKDSMEKKENTFKNILMLLISLSLLVISAKYVVSIGIKISEQIGIPAEIVSITFVSLGVCLPETIFSIESIKKNLSSLAIGDIFGTVIINSTIVLGMTSMIQPFSFERGIVVVAGSAMVLSSALVFIFLKTEKTLTKKEGICLILFYVFYISIQLLTNKIF